MASRLTKSSQAILLCFAIFCAFLLVAPSDASTSTKVHRHHRARSHGRHRISFPTLKTAAEIFAATGLEVDKKERTETLKWADDFQNHEFEMYLQRVDDTGGHARILLRYTTDLSAPKVYKYLVMDSHDSYMHPGGDASKPKIRITVVRLRESKFPDDQRNRPHPDNGVIPKLIGTSTLKKILTGVKIDLKPYNDDNNCSTFVNDIINKLGMNNDDLLRMLKATLKASREMFNTDLTDAAEGKLTLANVAASSSSSASSSAVSVAPAAAAQVAQERPSGRRF